MTTIRQIITDAYRESGLVQVGLTPEADEFDEGLRKLQVMIRSLLGHELGEPLRSVSYGVGATSNSYARNYDYESTINNRYVPANLRLLVNSNGAKTVYLPANPEDGAQVAVVDVAGNFAANNFTVNGNGRNIEGASSVILNTNSASKRWFYRADLGAWVLVNDLTADSQSPFPLEFDDFLITMLAIRMSPRYEEEIQQGTVEAYRRSRKQFIARYSQKDVASPQVGLLRLSVDSSWPSSNYDEFDTGRIT